ncbi:hypothetical protein Efla_002988 [Eimeria flavescens]
MTGSLLHRGPGGGGEPPSRAPCAATARPAGLPASLLVASGPASPLTALQQCPCCLHLNALSGSRNARPAQILRPLQYIHYPWFGAACASLQQKAAGLKANAAGSRHVEAPAGLQTPERAAGASLSLVSGCAAQRERGPSLIAAGAPLAAAATAGAPRKLLLPATPRLASPPPPRTSSGPPASRPARTPQKQQMKQLHQSTTAGQSQLFSSSRCMQQPQQMHAAEAQADACCSPS